MSPGQGRDAKSAASGPPNGPGLAAHYRATRARLMGRPPVAPPQILHRPSRDPARWLPELIAFNEDLRRLFGGCGAGAPTIAAERIRDVVAAHYRITAAEIVSGSSTRRCAWPRQVAMYICARHAGLSFAGIARRFGNRDQSTVRYAVAAVSARIAKDPALAAEVGKLIATCRGAPA